MTIKARGPVVPEAVPDPPSSNEIAKYMAMAIVLTEDPTFLERCRRYGLTTGEMIGRWRAQKGECSICLTSFSDPRPMVIDHNHETGAIRGLLCGRCNTGLGLLGDNPHVLHRAWGYLLDRGFYGAMPPSLAKVCGHHGEGLDDWARGLEERPKTERVQASEHRLYHRWRHRRGLDNDDCALCVRWGCLTPKPQQGTSRRERSRDRRATERGLA